MQMLNHFLGRRFPWCRHWLGSFKRARLWHYAVQIDTSAARIETPDFRPAYVIAEFMLNLLPMQNPPAPTCPGGLRDEHTSSGPTARFDFPADQDFIQIRKCD
jgi:hypothetical protein